jgi:ATPase domain predominantly from Archaea
MNNIENVLQYIDELMLQKTESELTPVQQAILTGVYQGKKYLQIAESFNNGCSESYIKQEAAKLWKKLGKVLGEDLNSDNFIRKIEKKYRVSQGDNSDYCMQVNEGNGNINICDKSLQTKDTQERSPSSSPTQTPIIDLKPALELNYNYGRSSEINTLQQWILENHTRLITIYGLNGIGKTTLIRKLINEITTDFDYIIYRSLDPVPKLISLKDDFNKIFSRSPSEPLPELIDYFCSYRCLVILDDVQNLFETSKLPSQYLTEYQDYENFFKQIVTSCHHSCLILISREKHENIENLEANYSEQIKTLPLQGLGDNSKEILKAKGLKDEHKWDELINLYQGHPYWLNIIASYINNYYENSVNDFIGDDNKLYLGNIIYYIYKHIYSNYQP